VTPSPDEPVLLDLNSSVFQRQFFSREKEQAWAVLKALTKLTAMQWSQVYRDAELKWGVISSRKGPHGQGLYTFRITQGFRGVACREGP